MLPTPAARIAQPGLDARHYQRHQLEQTLLYQIIEQHSPAFAAQLAAQGTVLPGYVQREFYDYLKCGRLEHGFLRVRCDGCHAEHLVAFSCKRRGFCPSCGARRMAESAALLVDEVLPLEPMRQWVLSFPYPLRFLFASRPAIMGRVNLTRFHGVFAPNSKHRALVTPAKRGKGSKPQALDEAQDQTPAERRASMSWAQRLKRVFNIDIETCRECGGAVNVIACIEDPVVIKKILAHRKEKAAPVPTGLLPESRAPPQAELFG
jgi:ribosomal protein S27E